MSKLNLKRKFALALLVFLVSGCKTVKDWTEENGYIYVSDASTLNIIGREVIKTDDFGKNQWFEVAPQKNEAPTEVSESGTELELGASFNTNRFLRAFFASANLKESTKVSLSRPSVYTISSYFPITDCQGGKKRITIAWKSLSTGNFCEARVLEAKGAASADLKISDVVNLVQSKDDDKATQGSQAQNTVQKGFSCSQSQSGNAVSKQNSGGSAGPVAGNAADTSTPTVGVSIGTYQKSRRSGSEIIVGYKPLTISCKPTLKNPVWALTDKYVDFWDLGLRVTVTYRWKYEWVDTVLLSVGTSGKFMNPPKEYKDPFKKLSQTNQKIGKLSKKSQKILGELKLNTKKLIAGGLSYVEANAASANVKSYPDQFKQLIHNTANLKSINEKTQQALINMANKAPSCRDNTRDTKLQCKLPIGDGFSIPGPGRTGHYIEVRYGDNGMLRIIANRYEYTIIQ